MRNNSHLTAIARKALPVPVRWLMERKLIHAPVMDFGCGKCGLINPKNWINYDPHYWDIAVEHYWDHCQTVLCTYVLCTLKPAERLPVLLNVQRLLTGTGIAYITVRNDKPTNGWGVSKKGTYQGRVTELKSLPLLHKCAAFRIYTLTKDTKLT